VETVTRNCCDKPATELFIVDGSPAAALAVGAHRPSQESTYVLSRAANEHGAEFKRRVLKRAARIRAREQIGSLWYVVGSSSLEPGSSVQLLEELLPLLGDGSRVTLATPRRHGSEVFGWIDELLSKSGSDVSMGVHFYADSSPGDSAPVHSAPASAAPAKLRRSLPSSSAESSLQCA
jgi:hypothetical protein